VKVDIVFEISSGQEHTGCELREIKSGEKWDK
jgi:hypothetical protein